MLNPSAITKYMGKMSRAAFLSIFWASPPNFFPADFFIVPSGRRQGGVQSNRDAEDVEESAVDWADWAGTVRLGAASPSSAAGCALGLRLTVLAFGGIATGGVSARGTRRGDTRRRGAVLAGASAVRQ